MDETHKDNKDNFELDDDEAEHLQFIPDKYIALLSLTNQGAVICGEMSAESCKGLIITNQKMILAMLVLKIVELIRTAIRGILLGHYSAVPVLLRSAIDSISVLLLVSKNDRQFKIWIMLSYIDQEQLEVDNNAKNYLRREFTRKARKSYDNLISDDPLLRPVTGIISELNAHVHPDVFGLFERAGFQTSLEHILGQAIHQALAISQGDPIEALNILDLKEKYPLGDKVKQSEDTETLTFGPGLIEEGFVDHFSQETHSATHHLFDIVEYLFADSCSGSTKKTGSVWHELSMKVFESLDYEDTIS